MINRCSWLKNGIWIICLAALVLVCRGGDVLGEATERVVPCTRLIGKIRLDGSLADMVWRGIPASAEFRSISDDKLADAQTEVRACHDDETLYVIATCREPDVSKIQALIKKRDGDLRQDDCIELYLATHPEVCYHLIVSASGAVYDARIRSDAKTDVAWDSRAKTAVQIFRKAWGVEVAIPLGQLALKPKSGTTIRFNVRRRRSQPKEVSSLMPTKEEFPENMEGFALLKFQGPPAWLEPLAEVRPRAGIRYSAADIKTARANVKRFDWAKSLAAGAVNNAERYLTEPASYYLSFMPPKGATFAYGFAGCPKCRARWPRFGARMCSFDKPGKITCPKCRAAFPSDDPKSPYFDPGEGVEIGGDMYYFKGVWHAWVINQYKAMLTNLSYAYALTGDERYAERAALIFDAMATLAPSTVGPRDNMRPHQKVVGRFHYYTQQWTEHLRSYLLCYDLLYHSETMGRVSPTNPTGFGAAEAFTIRQNIEKNLFLDTWDVEINTRNGRLPNLHNHTSATVRAMMGVGLVCGEPDLIRWGIEAAYKFIYNTIDPEGQYYETSGYGYNECGRQCNASFADMLYSFDPNNYEKPSRFPQPKDYPYQINLYRLPRMKLHLDRALYEMDCVGHRPRYGDGGGDVAVINDPIGEWRPIFFKWAFALYRSVENDGERRLYFREMAAATGGKLDEWFRRSWDALFWYKPLDDPPKYNPDENFSLHRSSLWGFKATAILRAEGGGNRLALLMRGGAIFPHGNDDTLHISLYSHGQMLTHEITYDLYGRPIHLGWATRSIAHCTVTVDERGGPPLYRGGPNADVLGFADGPAIRFVAMSAGPRCWKSQQQIKDYARACALVTLPHGGGYFVDLFNVKGGKQHDYSFHGQVTEKGEGFTLEGTQLEPLDNVWTLAGLSGYADATFDAPGRSWGERVLPGNRIRKLDIPGEKVGYFGWYPPPGNGYGFIYDIKTGPAKRRVQADWITNKDNNIHLRLTLFPGQDSTIITGKGPDLTGKWVIPFIIARRKGDDLKSSFLAATEGYTAKPRLNSVEEVSPLDGMRGLLLKAKDGLADRIWVDTKGRSAFVRTENGRVTELSLYQTPEVEYAGIGLKLASPALEGTIKSVAYGEHTVAADIKPANPSALCGQTLFVSSPDYSQNSAYRIEACDQEGMFGFGHIGFDLAMANYSRDGKDGRVVSSTPGTLVRSQGLTGMLDGKLALTADGVRSGLIGTFEHYSVFRFEPGFSIQKGDEFIIYDVKQGDHVRIPMTAAMRLRSDETWELFATGDVTVLLRADKTSYMNADGDWVSAPRVEGGFLVSAAQTARGRAILRVD